MHREVGRAKDLSAPAYLVTCVLLLINIKYIQYAALCRKELDVLHTVYFSLLPVHLQLSLLCVVLRNVAEESGFKIVEGI